MDCSSSSTTITSWKRYEYDGLNLLRVDERYDTAGGAIGDQDPWRKMEVSTHKPGSLGNLLGKMVYLYTGANQYTDTPSASYFYAYFYDAVGNLLWTVDNSGYLNYTFSQDAFGNELSVSPFSGTPWSAARTYCTNEHQTGKWIDPFTGLYFFHARWYDSGVGRWISRERSVFPYVFNYDNPVMRFDPNGLESVYVCYRDIPGYTGRIPTAGELLFEVFRPLFNLNGHCYLKLSKDGREARCGIYWGGNTHPDQPGTWPEDTNCTPISDVKLSCIIEGIRRVEKGEWGAVVPGFDDPDWSFTNNCCTAAWKVVNSCKKKVGEKPGAVFPGSPGTPPIIIEPEPIWAPIDDPEIPDMGGPYPDAECLEPIVTTD